MHPFKSTYIHIHSWRLKHITPQTFIILISILTGIIGGLAAIALKNAVHYSHIVAIHIIDRKGFHFLYLIFPLIGIAVTYLYVRFIVKDNINHGISRVLKAISTNKSVIKAHNMFTSLIASTITVSFGGSVGLEAPIVLTGSAIGSNLARYMRLDHKKMTLFLGCGAAGALAAVFKAPITGVVFSLEVLMLDLTMSSLIPLLISSASGAVLAYFFMGPAVLFSFPVEAHPFVLKNLPYYALLGLLCGVISLYFTEAALSIEKYFLRIQSGGRRLLIGGVVTSLLIFLFPPLFGEGYQTLIDLLNGHGMKILEGSIFAPMGNNYFFFILFLLFIIFFKVIAMSTTTGGGGVGGVFAPSLFVGGISGFLLSKGVNYFMYDRLPDSNFVLAGMAGSLAAVMHAPLTAIFLIAEITGGYNFFIPLMTTSIIAYLTILPFEKHSIYTKRLAQSGELITHNKDNAVLSLMSIQKLIETNFITTSPDITLGEFVKLIARSQRNVFPVIDEEHNFLGVVSLDDIRDIIFEQEKYSTVFVRNLMYMPDFVANYDMSMQDVVERFSDTSSYNIPVLKDGKYTGFVSRANLFSAYRKLVKDFSND